MVITGLLIMVIASVALQIFWWVMRVIENKSLSNLGLEDLNIPKSKFVHMVYDWCGNNIESNNPKPTIEVNYKKNKEYRGVYYPNDNSIVVYVNNTPQLIELVNTVIHEYVHSTQNTKGFDKLYDHYTQENGYFDNPFEQECERLSEKYQYQCLKDLINHYSILK